jgi:cytochrome c553
LIALETAAKLQQARTKVVDSQTTHYSGITMNKLAIALTSLLISALAPAALAQGDAAAGQAKSALCGSCHGVDGNSPLAMNPKLAGQGEGYLYKQLLEFKSGARQNATMAAMVMSLSDQDMQDLSAYYASQQLTIGGADAAKIELGESIYRAGNKELGVAACASCHSTDGTGNAPAKFPAVGGQHAEYTLSQLKAFRSGMRNNDAGAMMRSTVERLTDTELDALASYLEGLN